MPSVEPDELLAVVLPPGAAGAGVTRELPTDDLRHTAASLWLAADMPPYKVSRWLGHASLVTTGKMYRHLYPTDHSEDRAAFDAHVGELRGTRVAPMTKRETS